MNDSTVVQTVAGILDELGARFGSTGAHLWEQLVRYTVVEASVGAGIVVVAFFVAAGVFVVGAAKENDDIKFGGLLAMVSCGVAAAIVLSWAIPTILAPEAAVLMDLLP